jgi:hypothetical protein
VVVVLFTADRDQAEAFVAGPALSVMFGMALFAPTVVGFDFRPDLGRMEDLKTLPIPPSRLVLGQLITPVLVLTLAEWVTLAVIAVATRSDPFVPASAAALALPFNLMLFAIENLYFLWFPYRLTGLNAIDFQSMGRQMLLLMAKFACLGLAAGLAAGAGALAYFAAGRSWPLAVAAAWVAMAALGLALIPLAGRAFDAFDVAESLTD